MSTWGLETAVEAVPGGAVVTARGRVGRLTAARFSEALTAARRDTTRLVIDLQGVDYISGLGLAALGDVADSADAVILCGVSEAIRNTLELAGLTERVRIEESREAAMARLHTGL